MNHFKTEADCLAYIQMEFIATLKDDPQLNRRNPTCHE